MKRALCGAALIGALMAMTSCAATQGLLASGGGMFLKLGPATLGLSNDQQGWMALNSLNWAGGQYPQQGYPVATYPQQAYGYPQQTYGYPQQTYDTTGQTYPQQTYPQQTYDATGQTYPQQTYDATGQTYPQQTYDATGQTYPQQTYGATGTTQTYPQTAATGTVPTGAGLASLTTNDPNAAAALQQACASGQPLGTVTVRQVQPDGTYQDVQLNGVNIACGSPAAGGEKAGPLQPGEEVMMTFGDAKVVAKGKLKKG
ncbi:MAG TPA: hypothetical protein VIG90_10210 [Pedomonas sp.]|uniref:hypothetical protein n=1 Tax=Pedomonas sp. TaxID=2976421 RepID=UPI002F429F4E